MPTQRLHFEHFEIQTNDDGSLVKLGRGGMGTTYKAFDTRRRKHVALKIIADKLLDDRTSRRRFFNEARAASNLEHPNVVRVDYVCSDDAVECFYAMEWVDGESLGERVKHSGALPPREALLLLRAVADALTVLGEQRLVHRDIKPDNIMIARAGRAGSRVKLIDFGLAKALENASERFSSVDTGDHFVGSVYFSSPEQIRSREELDCRSDFYSLGATLWCVLTTLPPFTGTTFEVQKGHVENEPPWEKIAQFPACIQTLLRRLLAKDPAQRPPDAEALLAEWDAALADLEPASPKRPRDEAQYGDTELHSIAAVVKPVIAVTVDHTPPGCDAPSAPAWLARDAASGDWFAVRTVPPTLAPELRAEFLDAARAAQSAQHPSLLNVRDARDEEVISEWPPSVAATRLLAVQQGVLPLDVILAWLPKLAKTIDWACQHGLSRLGLNPARWQVAFEMLAENETPSERAARPPHEWGPHYVFLDPLAGFDPDLAAVATTHDNTVVAPPAAALNSSAEYLAALARALHELLGGRDRLRLSPLPSLDQPCNELLFAAIRSEVRFGSVSEWAAAFYECATRERNPSAAKPPSHGAQLPLFSFPKPAPSRRGKAWTTVAALIFVLGISVVWWQHEPRFGSEPQPTPAPELASPLLAAAAAAPATNDTVRAGEKITAAVEVAPGHRRVDAMRAELEKEKQRLATEAQRKAEEKKRIAFADAPMKARDLLPTGQREPTAAKSDATARAQEEALRRYPRIGVKGSVENAIFVECFRKLKEERPEFFDDPDWPLYLTEGVAKEQGWKRAK